MKLHQIHIDHQNLNEIERHVHPIPQNSLKLSVENYKIYFQGKLKPLFDINELSIILYWSNSLSQEYKINDKQHTIDLNDAIFYQVRCPELITPFTINLSFHSCFDQEHELNCKKVKCPYNNSCNSQNSNCIISKGLNTLRTWQLDSNNQATKNRFLHPKG